MDNTRWQKLEDLYSRALEEPSEERRAFLTRACEGDTSLLDELLDMLRLEEDAGRLLWMERVDDRPSRHRRILDGGERIGPYAVLEKLGQGGMGEVYLCERADAQYEQKVAVKVLRNDFAVAEATDRFKAERQILARLTHPNISTLLDGGVSDDGRPYFVMHYVDGIPVTEYCDEHRLSVRQRLDLFAKICDGVQFAHTNLVVHRDLKPSNILVAEDGVPKLLDFGIAKILSGGLDITRPLTTDARMLTPEHAAPEQILGQPVTTSTDVYALGVLLYEILVGVRPFEAEERATLEFQRRVCEEEPVPPSAMALQLVQSVANPEDTRVATLRRSGPGALVQALRGDLDCIVLKALRKEPERRYDSAGALAEDVRLHLAGHPVRATPDSFMYRSGKLLRRNRAAAGAFLAFVGLLIGSTVTIAMEQRQTALQRDRAERELAKSEAVTGFLIDLFDGNRPSEALGESLTARQLLDRGVARLDSLSGQPEIHARVLASVGEIYSSLGEYDRAAPLIERAAEVHRASPATVPADLSRTLEALADLRLDQGEFAAADTIAREALALRRATFYDQHPAVAESLGQLAVIQMQLGQYDQAEANLRELVELRTALYGESDIRVAGALSNLGKTLDSKGDYEESAIHYRAAAEIERNTYKGDHPDLAITLTNLGWSMYRERRYSEARDLFEEVVAMRRRLLGPEHPGVATTLNGLAAATSAVGDSDEAIEAYGEALAIYGKAFGEDHPSFATTAYNMARGLASAGRFEEAETRYRQALAIRRETLGADHPRTALVETYLGVALIQRGAFAEAEALLLSALRTVEDKLGPDHAWIAETHAKLAALYEAWDKPEEANRYRSS